MMAMIVQLNEFEPMTSNIVNGLKIFGIKSEIIGDKYGFHVDYSNPIHLHYLMSWNIPLSMIKAKNIIVHCHGSDSDIIKWKYHIPKTFLNIRKPLCLYAMPCLKNRLKWYRGEKKYFPIPIDTSRFKPIKAKKYPGRVLIWSQLSKVKGVEISFEVARLRPDLEFDIPYYGWDKEYYRKSAPKNVNFIEPVEHDLVPNLINKYEIAIGDFTKWGSFGTAPLETLACNVPTIHYIHPEHKYFYDTFPPFLNAKKPAEIAKLLDEREKTNTYRWVDKNHGLSNMMKFLIEIYRTQGFI
ncbi:MAG: hypothetical protein JW716_02865 [Candidatus Aenigmarchaeota archaeon]|nr:hypothetical protein [Candidatus Aenigmarchaeota archaeon]